MKLKPIIAAVAALAGVATAQADIVTVTGSLTTTDPTFDRAVEDFSALSVIGTAVRYDVYRFTVSATGDYTFLTTGSFDTFSALYVNSFNPANAITNGVVANDDLLGATTSGFTTTLAAGTNYIYVTTAFANTNLGSYSTTIGGSGVITAVPESSTYAMMALGLGMLGIARRRGKALAD